MKENNHEAVCAGDRCLEESRGLSPVMWRGKGTNTWLITSQVVLNLGDSEQGRREEHAGLGQG